MESFDVVVLRLAARKQPLRLPYWPAVGQWPARERLGVDFGIVDRWAPTPAVGDSVARVLEERGLETAGYAWDDGCLLL